MQLPLCHCATPLVHYLTSFLIHSFSGSVFYVLFSFRYQTILNQSRYPRTCRGVALQRKALNYIFNFKLLRQATERLVGFLPALHIGSRIA